MHLVGLAEHRPCIYLPNACPHEAGCLSRTCRSMSLGPTHLRLPALPSSARPLQMASSYLHSTAADPAAAESKNAAGLC
jgi:hypothetical protein